MPDYMIVGLGLSGIAVARELEKRNKSFVVYEDDSFNSSVVAGGVYNPVILKRFTLAWEVKEQLGTALDFYSEIEKGLGFSFHKKVPVYRRFSSVEEQNNWFAASDKPKLQEFLNVKLTKHINNCVKGDFSFGKINNTGIIDTSPLINKYREHLTSNGFFKIEKFQHSELKNLENGVAYKEVKAKAVIFCEGFGMKGNPFFNYLPLNGNKGEYLVIKAPKLQLDVIVKSSIFIIPMGSDLYKIGASYKHGDKSTVPTEASKEELVEQLEDLINCDYEIVDQEAGIRPSTIDRRPVIGRHPEHENIYLCNGFGSRGILIAPTAAKELVSFIEEGKQLPKEMDLERFTSKYYNN